MRTVHNQINSEKKKFQCSLCNYATARKTCLQSHRQHKHIYQAPVPEYNEKQVFDQDSDEDMLNDSKRFDPCLNCGLIEIKEKYCTDCKQKKGEILTEIKTETKYPTHGHNFDDNKLLSESVLPGDFLALQLKTNLCDLCDYKTLSKSNLNKHRKSVHEKIRYQCSR